MTTPAAEYLVLGVTPSGRVSVSPVSADEEWTWAAPTGTWRDEHDITEALLLELAATGSTVALPSAWLFWHEFALLYVIALCHLPEGASNSVTPPIDEARFASLAASAPPMPGGEYLSANSHAVSPFRDWR